MVGFLVTTSMIRGSDYRLPEDLAREVVEGGVIPEEKVWISLEANSNKYKDAFEGTGGFNEVFLEIVLVMASLRNDNLMEKEKTQKQPRAINYPQVKLKDVLGAFWNGIKPQKWLLFLLLSCIVLGNIAAIIAPLFYKQGMSKE